MDFGDDPLINTQYQDIHLRAVESLKPASAFSLQKLSQRNEWYKMSLAELKNVLVTPEMLVAADMKWKKLASNYGVQQLINFGFSWPTMLASGFKGEHLQCLNSVQMQQLGLNATRVLECRPHISNIVALHMSLADLKKQGWDLKLLQSIGLNMRNMVDFGYSLQDWVQHFNIQDFTALGFTNRIMCTQAGWRADDLKLAFASNEPLQKRKPLCINAENPAFTIQL